mgnify:FL=1|tara:strand:- start:129 stop:323 length:195 start_codon:yes stop_codon:yes gene_type:complete
MDKLCNDEKECNSISQILKLQATVIPKKKLLDKDMFDMSGLKKSKKSKKTNNKNKNKKSNKKKY